MSQRHRTFQEFWPFYLGEHRDARSRRLHFIGTTGWLLACGASVVLNPLFFPLAMAGFGALAWHADRTEPTRRPLAHVLGMLVLPSLASPLFLGGVVFAYGCAWYGHFRIEHNRPATFTYPVWSLRGDLNLWAQMLRGRLWQGDPAPAAAR
jgi:hypothetical protein